MIIFSSKKFFVFFSFKTLTPHFAAIFATTPPQTNKHEQEPNQTHLQQCNWSDMVGGGFFPFTLWFRTTHTALRSPLRNASTNKHTRAGTEFKPIHSNATAQIRLGILFFSFFLPFQSETLTPHLRNPHSQTHPQTTSTSKNLIQSHQVATSITSDFKRPFSPQIFLLYSVQKVGSQLRST